MPMRRPALAALAALACVAVLSALATATPTGTVQPELGLVAPFRPPLSAWTMTQRAFMTPRMIRLTPDEPRRAGAIWTKQPLALPGWAVTFDFRIHGRGSIGADGMAMWFTEMSQRPGPAFGSDDRFKGLGVLIDTFDNDNMKNNPYVSVMLNDGTKTYDKDGDNRGSEASRGCVMHAMRNPPEKSRIKVIYDEGVLQVLVDPQASGRFMPCVTLNSVFLPPTYYLGFSAATGEHTDNHDLLSVQVESIAHDEHASHPAETGQPEMMRATPVIAPDAAAQEQEQAESTETQLGGDVPDQGAAAEGEDPEGGSGGIAEMVQRRRDQRRRYIATNRVRRGPTSAAESVAAGGDDAQADESVTETDPAAAAAGAEARTISVSTSRATSSVTDSQTAATIAQLASDMAILRHGLSDLADQIAQLGAARDASAAPGAAASETLAELASRVSRETVAAARSSLLAAAGSKPGAAAAATDAAGGMSAEVLREQFEMLAHSISNLNDHVAHARSDASSTAQTQQAEVLRSIEDTKQLVRILRDAMQETVRNIDTTLRQFSTQMEAMLHERRAAAAANDGGASLGSLVPSASALVKIVMAASVVGLVVYLWRFFSRRRRSNAMGSLIGDRKSI